MSDVKMIVDHYTRYHKALERGQKINAALEAKELSRLAHVLGRSEDLDAIVEEVDLEGLQAYNQAGFHTTAMNGNREDAITNFIIQTNNQISLGRPKHLIVVTSDPRFQFLLNHAAQYQDINLALWAPRASVPVNLTRYNYRPLEDLLPETREAKLDVRIDIENLHIGLVKKGWKPDPRGLIEAIKAEVADLGEIVNMVAYADWDQLSHGSNYNLQREVAMAGVETRYLVNINGKNSADMKIADDIRTLVEKNATTDYVDAVVLATNDRDFRPALEAAKARGKRVIIIGLKDSISRQLQAIANEVRYIDMRVPIKPVEKESVELSKEHARLAMKSEVWLRQQNWKWTYANKLAEAVVATPNGLNQVRQALADRVFVPSLPPKTESNQRPGSTSTIMPNPKHPLIQTVRYLLDRVPGRLDECLIQQQKSYVNTNFLFQWMQRDETLRKLGVGQKYKDAEEWLNLVAETGIIEKRSMPHPTNPTATIITWRLPEEYSDVDLMLRWLITCADSQAAERNEAWASIKYMREKLTVFNHGVFQQALDQLMHRGEARLEKHDLSGRQHPVTGLHLSDEGELIVQLRSERDSIITELRQLNESGAKLTLSGLAEQMVNNPLQRLQEANIHRWWLVMQKEQLLLASPNSDDNGAFVLQHRHPLLKQDEVKPDHGESQAAPISTTKLSAAGAVEEGETPEEALVSKSSSPTPRRPLVYPTGVQQLNMAA